MGWCKSPSNGERCKCPVHTRIHLDQEKRNQRHEPWWRGLLFKSCLCPSSDVTWRPQNRKSDAEEEVTLKKSVAHDGRNCQVSVNFNLVLFGRKFILIITYKPDEFVQYIKTFVRSIRVFCLFCFVLFSESFIRLLESLLQQWHKQHNTVHLITRYA